MYLAFLVYRRTRAVRFGDAKPERLFLVVAPASVLLNWEAELER